MGTTKLPPKREVNDVGGGCGKCVPGWEMDGGGLDLLALRRRKVIKILKEPELDVRKFTLVNIDLVSPL